MGLQQGNFPPLEDHWNSQPCCCQTQQRRVWGILICRRELRRWLWFTWLQSLSSGAGLEAVEVVKNADRTADLVTVPCVLGGCGEHMKGRLQQPLGVVSSRSRRSQELTLIAGFNIWWHYAQTGLTSSDLVSFQCWWLIPRGRRGSSLSKKPEAKLAPRIPGKDAITRLKLWMNERQIASSNVLY